MTPRFRSRKFTYKRLKLVSRPVIALPLAVFVVFVVVSFITSALAHESVDSTRTRVIERRVQEDSLKLENRISSYELIASGGKGLVLTADVTADSWDLFTDSYNLPENFPAVNAVSYAVATDRADAQAYVDGRNAANGDTDLQLRPEDSEDLYLTVRYVGPDGTAFASRLGNDQFAYPSRRSVIEQAIADNKPALTTQPEMIRSDDDPTGPLQPGFILFNPVYDTSKPLTTAAQRHDALMGTVNVSFIAGKFFDKIYADSERQTRSFLTVYQGSDTSAPKIYQGGVEPAAGDAVAYTHVVNAGNQKFTFAYRFSDSDLLTSIERDRPALVFSVGTLLGFLLSIIMLFAIRGRLHRLSSDKEREIQGAKDELLSLASHQLRTPATGVKQYMGMVLQGFAGDITEQQRDFLQKAYESNDRQLHIINDILHLAKLDAGRIVLTKTDFDMSELVASVIDEQSDSAHDAEVALSRRLPKTLAVYADSHMMRMVVENLISNAIKYTHPGGKISVSLRSTGSRYELAVKDTGVGIAGEDMDKLFKQFSRVANERSHLVSGTGVGLYLVKNLVELHGGSVSLSSKAGKGTTFTVSFPNEQRL